MLAAAGQRGAGATRHQRRRPPEIFPVNFVTPRRAVLFRTAEGTKLVSAAINDKHLASVSRSDIRALRLV
jgi:hypothetical protein